MDHLINERGFWETGDGTGHLHDDRLMGGLIRFARGNKISRVIDFGCGMGDYVKGFRRVGLEAYGYDGNPNTEELTGGLGETLDLSEPFNLTHIGGRNDLVISLEVGEHIPVDYEDIFIDNLVRNSANVLILSWAIPGQEGLGHVNCRENGYIIWKLGEKGLRYDERWSGILRRTSRLPWFRKTIMVFRNEKGQG